MIYSHGEPIYVECLNCGGPVFAHLADMEFQCCFGLWRLSLPSREQLLASRTRP